MIDIAKFIAGYIKDHEGGLSMDQTSFLPNQVLSDLTNEAFADAKCDSGGLKITSTFPDKANIIPSELGPAMPFARWCLLQANHIIGIILSSAPVKIARSVIGFDSIPVKGKSPLAGSVKRLTNKPMNIGVFNTPRMIEGNSAVTGRTRVKAYLSPRYAGKNSLSRLHLPCQRLHTTQVANQVASRESGHINPSFHACLYSNSSNQSEVVS